MASKEAKASKGEAIPANASVRLESGRQNVSYKYILLIYIDGWGFPMTKSGVAKLFQNGSSQAVRLPQEFRFEGDRVRIRRVPHGVLLEPLISDVAEWFGELDRFDSDPFSAKDRNQPITPRRKIF
jgi:antitoxin VapB